MSLRFSPTRGAGAVNLSSFGAAATVAINTAIAVAAAAAAAASEAAAEAAETNIEALLGFLAGSPQIVTSGNVMIGNSDFIIVLNKSIQESTTFTLPAVASRDPVGLPLEVYDWTGLAGTMTFVPNGAEKIMGSTSSWTVTSGGAVQTGGSLRLIPSTDLSGWLVR